MIREASGNIFESSADCLVNPVNSQGVMGAGLALQFKKRFPENYKFYVQVCEKIFLPGQVAVFFENGKIILNAPTKIEWKDPSKLEYVTNSLSGIRLFLERQNSIGDVLSIAIPALGCGLGGLQWRLVRRAVLGKLSDLPNEIYLYAPKGVSPEV